MGRVPLNKEDIKEPDPQYTFKVDYYKSKAKGWVYVGDANNQKLVHVLFSDLRKNQQVELVDEWEVTRTYHVYWHLRYEGVQMNAKNGSWRMLRASPLVPK